MITFHALTQLTDPYIYIWRPANQDSNMDYDISLSCLAQRDQNGLVLFQSELDHQIHEYAYFKLFSGANWESDVHNRQIPRMDQYRFPSDIWMVSGTNRALIENPFSKAHDEVVIHLLTAKKYRGGKIHIWTPDKAAQEYAPIREEKEGLVFKIPLNGRDRHLFTFCFKDKNGNFEPDYANKLWCAHDGQEVWVHSNSADISAVKPQKKKLTIHFTKVQASQPLPQAHLWQSDSDFITDITEYKDVDDGRIFSCDIYTGRSYGFKFFQPQGPGSEPLWESTEANRRITIDRDTAIWTFEGDHELFYKSPVADRKIILRIQDRPPSCPLLGPMTLDVWINRSGYKLHDNLPMNSDGTWSFTTYPEVVTSFRFRSNEVTERIARHTVKIEDKNMAATELHIVLDRQDPLPQGTSTRLFQDPPFTIMRPGVWQHEDELRFAIHAPHAASVEIIGQWTDWEKKPIPMQSTHDEAYWWGCVPLSEITKASDGQSHHGIMYKFLFNGIQQRQDPAADWVENSASESASKLIDHARFQWQSNTWQTPGWEYLIVYQLHPKRFSQRFAQMNISPLRQLAEEITNQNGYLKDLGVTAIQLMPINEFAGDQSWGYNPSFYYAVESAYCGPDNGPDDLKYFVDTCHSHGLAVLLDVVFNHAGTSDNVLWSIAKDSFFDGDTAWGAMINFDHPQVIHFFEENLRYLRREFRIDGFRFDHTQTIVESHKPGWFIRQPGSGHGWDFLVKLRAAIRSLDPHCIMIAEHLPNDWYLTGDSGPLDSQWCDDFHDRLVDACKGYHVISALADSLKLTQTNGNQWYETTNYPESHDEVGNINDRIANVAGYGQGLRRNKVAATAALMSRGIPMWFMGAESGEWRQFRQDLDDALPIDEYINDEQKSKVRNWWNTLCDLRKGNPKIQGPSPLNVRFAQEDTLAFTRGEGEEYFVIMNFGWQNRWRSLSEMNLPWGSYKELWNSTWPAFAVESEDEHTNGGRDARLTRDNWVSIPEYGAIVMEKV